MMTKSKLMSIILVVISILIIVGVILMWWMLTHQGQRSLYNVQLDVGQTVTIPFKDVALVPGGEFEYVIRFDQASSSEYDLTLDIAERESDGLEQYARIKLLADGELLCDELLKNVFEGGLFVIPVDFSEEESMKLKIVYYLPEDIGNEAKNTKSVFDLVFTATSK